MKALTIWQPWASLIARRAGFMDLAGEDRGMKKRIYARMVAIEIETDDPTVLPEIIANLIGRVLAPEAAQTPLPAPPENTPRKRRRATSARP